MPLEKVNYPHPHVDPRCPRDGDNPQTNPPVFAWKPRASKQAKSFQLIVGKTPGLKDPLIKLRKLEDPVHLPVKALKPGTYYWRWGQGNWKSKVFSFKIKRQAVRIEVPKAGEWIKAFSGQHPRFLFPDGAGPELLKRLKARDPKSIRALFSHAETFLGQSHHMAEPPYRGDRETNYKRFRKVQFEAMWGSRRFANGAQIMALAYALGGRKEFGRAAARRLASLAKWDPYGSTHLEENDEPHMSVIWYGTIACDWAWDCFSEKERTAVIDQMRTRAAITFEHMHDLGQYGIERFDSHAGREIVFLANLLFIFHEYIPEAEAWLDWLRPVLCGIWPIWAENDGSWAEGISYGTAYVNIMTLFASALKRGTGVDLYRKAFWKNYARWRMVCMPPYAEWIGFGDHSERWPAAWLNTANMIELIGRETGTAEFDAYVAHLREETKTMQPTPLQRRLPTLNLPLLLHPSDGKPKVGRDSAKRTLHPFMDAGWAAFRSDMDRPDRDVALIFRSSPYGSVSHSHANNNDFVLHAGGTVLAMPSGYYSGYASAHHAHWIWHTESHNCVTLSGAPQLLRSPESRGELLSAHEDEKIAYVLGNADESYSDRASRCRRHVLYFKKEKLFLLLDDFIPLPDVVSSFQWNIHSWAKFTIKESQRVFSLRRKGASLTGTLLFHRDGFFVQSEGWDVPPLTTGLNSDQWHNQHHLRFTPNSMIGETLVGTPIMRFGVLLVPGTRKIRPPVVKAWLEDGIEKAAFASTQIEILPAGKQPEKESIARIRIGRKAYRLGPSGIRKG